MIDMLLPYIMSAGIAVLSGLCGISVKVLWHLASNVAELNSKIGTIMAELSYKTQRADRTDQLLQGLSERLLLVERKVFN